MVHQYRQSIFGAINHIILLLVGVGLITLPIFLIKRMNTFITVSGKMVKGQTGLFNIKTVETSIVRIDTVQINQGILGRKFDFGEITIKSGTSTYNYKYIEQPYEIKMLIESGM